VIDAGFVIAVVCGTAAGMLVLVTALLWTER
jgi:hypothetical protein